MKHAILGFLAFSVAAVGSAAHAQLTTLDYTAAVTGGFDFYKGPQQIYNGAINFSGILTAQIVLDMTSQGLQLKSFNVEVIGLPNGLWQAGGGGPTGFVSTSTTGTTFSYFSFGTTEFVSVNTALTSGAIVVDHHAYHAPIVTMNVGANDSISYEYTGVYGGCAEGVYNGL